MRAKGLRLNRKWAKPSVVAANGSKLAASLRERREEQLKRRRLRRKKDRE